MTMYYRNTLNMKFSFICISVTWATKLMDHLLNISNYNHEQCIRPNNYDGGGGEGFGGTSFYNIIHNAIQYKNIIDSYIFKN